MTKTHSLSQDSVSKCSVYNRCSNIFRINKDSDEPCINGFWIVMCIKFGVIMTQVRKSLWGLVDEGKMVRDAHRLKIKDQLSDK